MTWTDSTCIKILLTKTEAILVTMLQYKHRPQIILNQTPKEYVNSLKLIRLILVTQLT